MKISIKFSTIHKIIYFIATAIMTYAVLNSQPNYVNIILILVISVLFGICGAITQHFIDKSVELDGMVLLHRDLYNIKYCTSDCGLDDTPFEKTDFVFNGRSREETQDIIDTLNKYIVANIHIISCGKYGYCLYFVDLDDDTYRMIRFIVASLELDPSCYITREEYGLIDITDLMYNILLCDSENYKLRLKYDKLNDKHYIGIIDKNTI